MCPVHVELVSTNKKYRWFIKLGLSKRPFKDTHSNQFQGQNVIRHVTMTTKFDSLFWGKFMKKLGFINAKSRLVRAQVEQLKAEPLVNERKNSEEGFPLFYKKGKNKDGTPFITKKEKIKVGPLNVSLNMVKIKEGPLWINNRAWGYMLHNMR